MSNRKEDRRVLEVIAVSAIIIASVLIYSIAAPRASNPFFSLGILDQNLMAPSKMMNVTVDQTYTFHLGSQNEMGKSESCVLIVKLRNTTQPVPVTSTATPSDLPTLESYSFSLKEGEKWASQFDFSIFGNFSSNSFSIQQITINNVSISPVLHADYDAVSNGFQFQFIYELWFLENSGGSYFSGVWVSSPFLNITQ